MNKRIAIAGALAQALLLSPAHAASVFWGLQVEQFEYRLGDDADVFAWDFDAFIGSDELRVVWRSEGEYSDDEDAFETLENQLRVQVPVSDFFDAVAGVRLDTPENDSRVYGVLGIHGLAPQWFEIDADLFIAANPSFRFEAEYEALITNRLILTPSIEVDLPLTDDADTNAYAFGPKVELGARLSYDLIDRALAPYIGVHYERVFGETANFARGRSEDVDALFFVVGLRVLY